MALTPYQILAPAVSLLAIVYAWNLFIRRKKTLWEALLWTMFWGAIAFIAFQPWVLTYLSVATGIKDQESAVLITFLGVLFFMIFYLVIRLEELEQRHARLVRAIALRDAGMTKKEADETEESEESGE